MRIDWINIESVSKELTDSFYSGDETFDFFLKEKARDWQDSGETATYIFADKDEIDSGNLTRIFGYASINATGLLNYHDKEAEYLSCAEIRMFAIQNALRSNGDPTRKFSDIIFNSLLANLYYIATHTVGFKAIYLNANQAGKSLYLENGFQEVSNYVIPTAESMLDIEGTTPMILMINDNFIDQVFS